MLCIVQALILLLLALVCQYGTSVAAINVVQICHVITEHQYILNLHNTAAAALLSSCCSSDVEVCLTDGILRNLIAGRLVPI